MANESRIFRLPQGIPLEKTVCPDCGFELAPGSKFCPNCGKKL